MKDPKDKSTDQSHDYVGFNIDLSTASTAELQRLYKSVLHYRAKPKIYVPHEKQEELHRSNAKIIIASAGNRGGKSDAGCNELIWRVTGTHPFKRVRTPCKAWAGSYDFKNSINKIIWPKIKAALDNRLIDDIHHTQGIVDHIKLINGSIIEFKSYEQPSTKWEGDDLDFLWLDEPPPKEHYIAARRGLIDRGGDVLITATMVNDAWVSDELIEPALEGKRKDIFVISWSSYDNPHVDQDEVKRFENDLPPEDRPIRIYGKIRELTGRCIKRFKDDEPFVIPTYKWPLHWPWFEFLDPHPSSSKGHYVMRMGVTPRKDVIIFNTMIQSSSEGTMPELARAILRSRELNGLTTPVIPTISDTSLNSYDPEVKRNLKDYLELSGVTTILAEKKDKIVPGFETINQMLWNTERNVPGGLYIMDECREAPGGKSIVREWKLLLWDTKDHGKAKTKGDDDFTDLVRYGVTMDLLLMVEPGFFDNIPAMKHDYAKTVKRRDTGKYTNKDFDYDKDEDDEPTTPDQHGFSFKVDRRRFY